MLKLSHTLYTQVYEEYKLSFLGSSTSVFALQHLNVTQY
jgi:hypothetical protein